MQPLGARFTPLLLLIPLSAAGLSAVAPTLTPLEDPPPPEAIHHGLVVKRVLENGNPYGAFDQGVIDVLDELRPVMGAQGEHDVYVGTIEGALTPGHDAVLKNNEGPVYQWCYSDEYGWVRYCLRTTRLTINDLDDARGQISVEVATKVHFDVY